MSKVYTEKVAKAQSLAEGLKRNFDRVKGLGITDEQIQKLISTAEETAKMSEELDALREVVKVKASAANAKLTELTDCLRDAKQIVKTNFDQLSWIDFGIEDKR
ncbi:MAG: hypothetical protein IJ328_01700 [Muribaculaceae bacterium]|nr:hypothetical protein [Muribaculaceae bacterium]